MNNSYGPWAYINGGSEGIGAEIGNVLAGNGINICMSARNSGALNKQQEHLKDTYGDRIVFWGGGVDTQKVLAFGSEADVRKQVHTECDILSRNGGFVFNTVHNIVAIHARQNGQTQLGANTIHFDQSAKQFTITLFVKAIELLRCFTDRQMRV